MIKARCHCAGDAAPACGGFERILNGQRRLGNIGATRYRHAGHGLRKRQVLYHRRAGEALHEAREDAAAIARAARELGSAHFAAQYQQQPVAEESAMLSLSWFKRFDLEPYARTILGHGD